MESLERMNAGSAGFSHGFGVLTGGDLFVNRRDQGRFKHSVLRVEHSCLLLVKGFMQSNCG